MKKILPLILIIGIMSACTTNPYTYEDYEAGKKPAFPFLSPVTGNIPGLSQIIHGEYIEALIIWGAILGGTAIAIAGDLNTPDNLDGKITPMTSGGISLMAGGILYNYVDAYATSITRRNQYKACMAKEEREARNLQLQEERQADMKRYEGYRTILTPVQEKLENRQWDTFRSDISGFITQYELSRDSFGLAMAKALQWAGFLRYHAHLFAALDSLENLDEASRAILDEYHEKTGVDKDPLNIMTVSAYLLQGLTLIEKEGIEIDWDTMIGGHIFESYLTLNRIYNRDTWRESIKNARNTSDNPLWRVDFEMLFGVAPGDLTQDDRRYLYSYAEDLLELLR